MDDKHSAKIVAESWDHAEQSMSELGGGCHARLLAAVGAIDVVWDQFVFEKADSFGGTEIGFARTLSGPILARLLGIESAAVVSVAGGDIPPTGNDSLDEGLASARQEALDTFSGELLGPVELEGRQIYALPMLLDSPIPIGAAILVSREELSEEQGRLLQGYLMHFDTRLNLAEQLLKLRRDNTQLKYELRKLHGEVDDSKPPAERGFAPLSSDLQESLARLAEATPHLEFFGVPLPTRTFGAFCSELKGLTNTYLEILEQAPNLYLDVPNGVDAKSGSRLAAPYERLLGVMGALRRVVVPLAHATPEDLVPFCVGGRMPTFSDLTRVAKTRVRDETSATILEIMNDQGEELELDAVAARHHPYEFRVANTGEVFALLALFRTLKFNEPKLLDLHSNRIFSALPEYEAARAYLFSYDRFEDVPLKGVDRTQLPAAENLLLLREKAPSFGVLLRAYEK